MNNQLERLQSVNVPDWRVFDVTTALADGAPDGATITLYAIDTNGTPIQIPMNDPDSFGNMNNPLEIRIVVLVPTAPNSTKNYRFQTSAIYAL
jgi:hypothetical protein